MFIISNGLDAFDMMLLGYGNPGNLTGIDDQYLNPLGGNHSGQVGAPNRVWTAVTPFTIRRHRLVLGPNTKAATTFQVIINENFAAPVATINVGANASGLFQTAAELNINIVVGDRLLFRRNFFNIAGQITGITQFMEIVQYS